MPAGDVNDVAAPASGSEGLRIAVTIPPAHYRAGNERNQMRQQAGMLRALGHRVHEVDTTPFDSARSEGMEREIRDLEAFRPEVAFGTPNAGYVLMLKVGADPDGAPRNLFADHLGIPTVLLWDDPGQIVSILDQPGDPDLGIVERVRRVLDHPLYVHGIYDAGHILLMQDLGMLTTGNVVRVPGCAHPRFVAFGSRGDRPDKVRDVAFAGNLLVEARAAALQSFGDFYRELEAYVVGRKVRDAGLSVWGLMNEALGRMPPEVLARNGLVPDHRLFWRLYGSLAGPSANTLLRIQLLSAVRHEVEAFGMFVDQASKDAVATVPNVVYGGFLDVATQLPEMYATTRITVDWINGIYIDAYTTKNVNCLAAGGFPLLSASRHFDEWLGEPGRACQFRTPEEAADKVEYFLAHPAERDELARELQQRVLKDLTMAGMFSRLIAKAAEMNR